MDVWKTEALRLVNRMLWNPDTMLEYYALMGLGLLMYMAVLAKVSTAMDAKMSGAPRAFLAAILGGVLIFASMTAAILFILPSVNPTIAKWVVPGAAAVVLLVIVAPLSCVIFKFSYLSSLLTWLVTIGAAAGFIYVGSMVFDTAFKAKADAGKAEERKESLQGFIDMQQ